MSRPHRHRDAFGLIGWLFADLMLVLAVLFLASSTVARPVPAPSGSSSASARPSSPSPLPTPTVAPTPACRPTIVLKKNTVLVPPDSGGRRASDAILGSQFRQFAAFRVGLLQTFVHGSSPSDGVRQAEEVNLMIQNAFPNAVSEQTIKDAFFDGNPSLGTVRFDVYLIADTCS